MYSCGVVFSPIHDDTLSCPTPSSYVRMNKLRCKRILSAKELIFMSKAGFFFLFWLAGSRLRIDVCRSCTVEVMETRDGAREVKLCLNAKTLQTGELQDDVVGASGLVPSTLSDTVH